MFPLRSASAGFGIVLLSASPGAAQQLASANAKGTLTVEYSYESTGTEKEKGSIGQVTWRAKRNATISADVFAQPANDIPVLHDQKAALANAQRKVDQGFGIAGRLSPSLSAAEAIGEKCGDDEACFEREGMRLAQEMQGNGQLKTLQDSRGEIEGLMRPGSRYQYWGGNFGAGRYVIDETVEITVLDPGERIPYTQTIVRRGNGALPAAVKGVKIPTTGRGILTGAEYDSAGATLALKLPIPGLTPGTETISGQDSDGRPAGGGPQDKMLDFPVKLPGNDKPLIVKIKGNWRDQSGQDVIRFTKGRWQEKGTLTIRWRFTAG